MKKTLLSGLIVLTATIGLCQGLKVEYILENNEYQLYRDGNPYFIKGAAYSGHFLDSLPVYGGNSIRTYSTNAATADLLDKADSLGLTVTLGLYTRREVDGFNYNDTSAVKEQLEDFRYWVKQYRDHPAVLMWSIGNEADASYTNYKLWDAVNDIAEMIHKEDTLHPTMTVLASAHDVDIIEINARAPAIDVLGINVYKTLDNLGTQLTNNNWTKPYVVTEWGVDGTWQTDETSWRAPIELSSTSKAFIYRNRYKNYIKSNPINQCLGSYAFVWGHQNHGEVETWYSMFTVNGESTEVVESMQYEWTGSYPSQRAPRITGMVLNGSTKDDNVTLAGGAINWATVEAYDPNGDHLTYEWAIVKEGYDLDDTGPGKNLPGLEGLITYENGDSIAFATPAGKGGYRLYVIVHDGNSKVALMGIPFQVEYGYNVLENFEGTSVLNLTSSVGAFSHVANPNASGLNKTGSVGRYVAPGNSPYDKFTFSSGVAIEDAGKFKNGDFSIKMELYTNAPIGTPLQLNFQNAAASGSFPNGRHSVYKAATAAQNQWTTITFSYHTSPDPSVEDISVDQLVFAFDAGTSSDYTYYIDNIRIERQAEDKLSSDLVFQNYETINLISYLGASGTYEVVANPWVGGVNKTDSTSRYTRNPSATYDGLTFVNEEITDASAYETGSKGLAINLHTDAPAGTLMEIQLRNDSMFGGNPAGRHSIYKARVLKQNEWHRVIFNHASSPDTSVPDDKIDRMVFLLSPGVAMPGTFYIDNIRSIGINIDQPNLPLPWQNTDIGAVGRAGSTVDRHSGKVFVVQGSGADIGGTGDEFQYAYQPFEGDGEIICMIPSISPDVDEYAKAGLMLRETLDPGAKNATVYITPNNGNAFQYRSSVPGTTSKTPVSSSVDRWLKLKRTGDLFEGYQSNDGETWALIASETITMSSSAYIGLAVTAHDNTKRAKATFRDISIIQTAHPPIGRQAESFPPVVSEKLVQHPYPNPTHDVINIKSYGVKIQDFAIYDLHGRKTVCPYAISISGDTFQADLRDLPAGIYIFEMWIEGVQARSRIIKK